ncbi:hypothetical protein HYH03_016815 [Edaphochlamys debaryana]|uniref:Peptidase S54 rhomboid domain-containing protein n=1 Tax=Edaphochlamys debaryana TaxID=47281 RepID=A0A835XLF2_9CHLO|nr:hypothetical protein HYH03_016815 [Edaphochlamys debaryana]|eukprot:KAG2484401.1 hypothetical protein HYH03_016815 [Edaphochlamys debaryana]
MQALGPLQRSSPRSCRSRALAWTNTLPASRPCLRPRARDAPGICAAAGKKGSSASSSSDDSLVSASGLAKSLLKDVVAGLSSPTPSRRSRETTTAGGGSLPEDLRSPSYAIAALNTALFLACALVPLLPAASMLLNHKQPQVWQLLTSCFAHSSLEGLLQCVFFIYVFGRVVERNHGSIATWAVYISCGMAAAALAWWMLPAKAVMLSSAAPAAAWGMFLVGVGLPRLSKKPLEVACLAPFAFAATTSRYAPFSSALLDGGGTAVGHLVHIAGASLAAAVASMILGVVESVREAVERKRLEAKRQADAASQEETVNRIVNLASQAAQQLGKKLS